MSILDFDDDRKMCPRCSKDKLCCEMLWTECETCGSDGVDGHDCGEDTCCCLNPGENMTCGICDGAGGWWTCDCDDNGVHTCKRCGLPGHTSESCKKARTAREGG